MANMASQGGHPSQHLGVQIGSANRQHSVAQTPSFPISYAGFMVRRGRALDGHRADWSQPQIESYSVTPKEVEKKKTKANGYDAITVYHALKSDAQRLAVSKVLGTQRFNEKNIFANWDYAVIFPRKEKVPGSLGYASEIKSIDVILKRHPKALDSYTQMPLSNSYEIQMNHSMHSQFNPKMNHMPQGNAKVNSMPGSSQGHGILPPPPHLQNGNIHPVGQPLNNMPREPRVDPRGQEQQQGLPRPLPNAMSGGNNQHRPTNNKPMQGNPARTSTHNMESMQGYRDRNGSFIEIESLDSDDSDSSGANIPRKKPMNSRNLQGSMGQDLPKPPLGLPYQSSGSQKQFRLASPTLKKKVSVKDIPTKDGGVYRVKTETTKRSRRNSGGSSSTSSFDMLSDVSQGSHSTRATDYSHRSSEYGHRHRSRSHERARKDHGLRSRHRHSLSRDRLSRDRYSRRHDDDRNSRGSKYREHRRPSPFHGLSSSRDSDSDRERRIKMYNRYQYPGQSRRSLSPAGSSNASLWGDSLHLKRLNDPYDMRGLRIDLPPVAMAPTSLPSRLANAEAMRRSQVLKEQERRKEQEVEAYMRSEEQKAREIDAFERGRSIHKQRMRTTATDALFDSPIEQQRRRLEDRDWEDVHWDGRRAPRRSTQDEWRIADDVLSYNHVTGGYGTSDSKRYSNDQYDDARYGQTGFSMRGAKNAYLP